MPASRKMLRVVDRRVRLVAVEVQRAGSRRIEGREGVQIVVVAAAHDGALAALRHDEGQRRSATFRWWTEMPYFAAMSMNMRPSQSSATEVRRSGTMPSLAQAKAAVTALPPNEMA